MVILLKGGNKKTLLVLKNMTFLLVGNMNTIKMSNLLCHLINITLLLPVGITRYKKKEQEYEYLKSKGDVKQAETIRVKIQKIKDVKARTTPSKVSTNDAMEARKHPLLSTGKDIGRIAHKAGLESMKTGTAIGGGISVLKNVYSLTSGHKKLNEAVIDIALDTGKYAAISYTTGAGCSIVGGALKSTSSQFLQNLSKGKGPAAIINTGAILAKQTIALVSGNISGEEFVRNIGQEGTTLASSMTGANLGAIAGTFIMPGVGSIVGGVLGGMVASMLSGAIYVELQKSITATKLSNEQKAIIADICKQLKEQEKQYQTMLNECFDYFLDDKERQIKDSLNIISEAIESGTSIYAGLEQLGKAFDKQLAFASTEEFIRHVENGDCLKL